LNGFNDKFGGFQVEKLSEEHGFVKKRDGFDINTKYFLNIGSKLRIVPNHSCPVANLFNEYHIIQNDVFIDKWNVDARGLSK
jgi:D-serine deaminase-like pyridoxal phosphate-dependent protein